MNGERHENARAARRRLRKEAAIVREEFLLRCYASGDTMEEIATKMELEFGSCSISHLYEMLPRALARFADRIDSETVEQARATYVLRLEMLLSGWMPRALGLPFGDDGNPVPPDPRIGELVLKANDRIAEVKGARERPKRGDINLNIQLPPDPDSARRAIMAELAKEAQKHQVIQGQLATVGTDLDQLTSGEEDDEMPPPIGPADNEPQTAEAA